MALTLTGLRCLVQIVDCDLNVTAASAAMHLSQPCVSRQLQQTEDALGFRVFTRRGRNLAGLTEPGRRVIEVARRVVHDLDGLRRMAPGRIGDGCDDIAIAASQTYASHVLPPLLQRLRERFPAVGVSLLPIGDGERVRPSEHSRCDVVLVTTAGDERPEGIALPLFRWQRVVIVGRDHPLAEQRRAVTLVQLAGLPLITYEASRRPASSLCRALAAAGLSIRFSCSAHDGDTLKAYTRAGLGVGLVAELSLLPADREHFRVLPVDPALPDCTAWAVLPDDRPLREPARELVRLLAPQLPPDALRGALAGAPPDHWPEAPLIRTGADVLRAASRADLPSRPPAPLEWNVRVDRRPGLADAPCV